MVIDFLLPFRKWFVLTRVMPTGSPPAILSQGHGKERVCVREFISQEKITRFEIRNAQSVKSIKQRIAKHS